MKFPKEHRKVFRLLKQDKASCYASAVCMAIETQTKGEVKLDFLKFHKELTSDGRQPHLTKALKLAKLKGVPVENSKERFYILNYRLVQRQLDPNKENIYGCIKDGFAVMISLDWGNTETLTDLTKDGIVQPRYKYMHAVLGVDTVGLSAVLFCNPHGSHYGKDGYGVIDLNHGVDRKTIEKGYILFT